MHLPTLLQDGFCLHPANGPVTPGMVQPGHLCRLSFEIGFADERGRPFSHHQTLWVAVTAVLPTHCLGTLLEGPFLFVDESDEILRPGTELPFLAVHVCDVLTVDDLGPEERAAASRPACRRWAA